MKTVSTHPTLSLYWDTGRNVVKADTITMGGTQPHYWTCVNRHTWSMTVPSMLARKSKPQVCPFCAKERISLMDTHPEFQDEWNAKLNLPLVFSDLSTKSHIAVWWDMPCTHTWKTSAQRRTLGSACAYCTNNTVLSGYNDIATTHPDLVPQIHTDDRDKSRSVSFGSNRKLRWVCSSGHESTARVADRRRFGCPYCSGRLAIPGETDLLSKHPEAMYEWSTLNIVDINTIASSSNTKVWWTCQTCLHTWQASPNARWGPKKNHGCPRCSTLKKTSSGEDEVYDYIVSLLPNEKIYSSSRKLLWPQELDIYIPSHNLAIEYNGLYWHSEAHKSKSYHYDKWKLCKDRGVQLVQIWEDDWKNPNTQARIKEMLKHKLGVSSAPRVPGRKTQPKHITYLEAKTFLNNNHIQGEAKGSLYVGLEHKETLVAVMVVGPASPDGRYYLHRYATQGIVQGGFNKLLKYAESQLADITTWVTFADHEVSTGNLYTSSGFVAIKEIKPDYKYVVKNKREHKFNYRKSAFKSREDLKYREDLTELKLAKLNKLPRVWDSGKTRYEKNV